jgi:general stress protein YciG
MPEKLRRGFASMDLEKRRVIASKGGKAAHEKGRAHEFTPEEAREAGRKGGHVAHEKGTAHRFTSEEARAAGRKGGQKSRARLAPVAPAAEQPLAIPAFSQQAVPQWPTETSSSIPGDR